MAQVPFRPPAIGWVSNVTAGDESASGTAFQCSRSGNSRRRCEPIGEEPPGRRLAGTEAIKSLLVSQVTSTVEWVKCMQHARSVARGQPQFLELGPGAVLSESKAGFPASSSTSLSGFTVGLDRRSNCAVRPVLPQVLAGVVKADYPDASVTSLGGCEALRSYVNTVGNAR